MRRVLRFSALSVALLGALAVASSASARGRQARNAPEPAAALRVDLPEGGVQVPMLRQLHLPALEVMVNGEGPFKMGLDTGASGYISFNQDVADRLGLVEVDRITASDGTGRNAREIAMYGVETVQIGDAAFHDLRGHVGNYNRGPLAAEPIDGIIGIGLFAGLTLTLDYPNDVIGVSREALPAPDGVEVFQAHADSPVPTIDLVIGDAMIAAHIDARNMGALTIPGSLVDGLATIGAPAEIGTARTQFNEIPISAVQFDGDIAIGRHVLRQPALVYADIFRSANIGSRVLEHFTMTFDMANARVRFARKGDGPIEVPMPQARRAPGG